MAETHKIFGFANKTENEMKKMRMKMKLQGLQTVTIHNLSGCENIHNLLHNIYLYT